MAVGESNPWDKKYEGEATLKVDNKKYTKNVYGVKKNKKKKFSDKELRRRDIFAPNDIKKLPKTTTAEWRGNKYQAELSFRYRKGGGKIPVYEFYVGSE